MRLSNPPPSGEFVPKEKPSQSKWNYLDLPDALITVVLGSLGSLGFFVLRAPEWG